MESLTIKQIVPKLVNPTRSSGLGMSDPVLDQGAQGGAILIGKFRCKIFDRIFLVLNFQWELPVEKVWGGNVEKQNKWVPHRLSVFNLNYSNPQKPLITVGLVSISFGSSHH